MRFRTFAPALLLFACSCAGGEGQEEDDGTSPDLGDERLVVPEGITLTALEGGAGSLNLIALTVLARAGGIEMYATVKNEGPVPACSAGLAVDLFDKEGASLGGGIGGLLMTDFYRLTDGSGNILACVPPGELTMAWIIDLPAEIAPEDLGTVVYRCPHWLLDVEPLDGLELSGIKRVPMDASTAYTGTFTNRFDLGISNPSVTVFPVNRVGRPLGAAIATATLEVAPGGSWSFTTSAVDSSVVGFAAYPEGALVMQ
jgi:hypothetical protein